MAKRAPAVGGELPSAKHGAWRFRDARPAGYPSVSGSFCGRLRGAEWAAEEHDVRLWPVNGVVDPASALLDADAPPLALPSTGKQAGSCQ